MNASKCSEVWKCALKACRKKNSENYSHAKGAMSIIMVDAIKHQNKNKYNQWSHKILNFPFLSISFKPRDEENT